MKNITITHNLNNFLTPKRKIITPKRISHTNSLTQKLNTNLSYSFYFGYMIPIKTTLIYKALPIPTLEEPNAPPNELHA